MNKRTLLFSSLSYPQKRKQSDGKLCRRNERVTEPR